MLQYSLADGQPAGYFALFNLNLSLALGSGKLRNQGGGQS